MADNKAAVERPLSPHLFIYKPMLTMMMSIAHRITGMALYFGTLLVAWWLIAVLGLALLGLAGTWGYQRWHDGRLWESFLARLRAQPGIVVTETGWPTTFGPIGAQQFPVGISNARDYLQRVTGWAQAQQVVLCIHNMFDDQFGVDPSSPYNYHFGLIDATGKPKGILF